MRRIIAFLIAAVMLCALSALKPENKDMFLVPAKIAFVEEFAVARSFSLKQLTDPSILCQHENWAAENILKGFC